MKKCPYCAEEIQDEAVFCRFCNHDLAKQHKFKSFLPIIIAVTFAIFILGAVYIIYSNNTINKNNLQTALSANADQKNSLDVLTSVKSKMLIELNEKEENLANANQSIQRLEESAINAKETQTSLEDAYKELDAEIKDLNSKYLQAKTNLSHLEEINVCEELSDYPNIELNSSSNSTISNSLEDFIGEIRGKVLDSDWETIWTDSRAAAHKIRTGEVDDTMMDVFIVYFDEDDFSKKSVYWANRQCWLDR